MNDKQLEKIKYLLAESLETPEEIANTYAGISENEEKDEEKAEKAEEKGEDMETAEAENQPEEKKEKVDEMVRLREMVEPEEDRIDIKLDPEQQKMLEAIARLGISEMVTNAATDLRKGAKYSVEEAQQDAKIIAEGVAKWADKFAKTVNECFAGKDAKEEKETVEESKKEKKKK